MDSKVKFIQVTSAGLATTPAVIGQVIRTTTAPLAYYLDVSNNIADRIRFDNDIRFGINGVGEFTAQGNTWNDLNPTYLDETKIYFNPHARQFVMFVNQPNLVQGGKTYPQKQLNVVPVMAVVAFLKTGSATSPSGSGRTLLDWSRTTLPVSTAIQSIAYGNNKFVASAIHNSAHVIVDSTDGINWVNRGSGSIPSYAFVNLKFVNNLFIGTDATQIFTSTDGITWTYRWHSLEDTWGLSVITYGNGIYVITLTGGSQFLTSSNGTTWSPATITGLSGVVTDIAFGNGVFVAVSTSGVFTSTNGTSWTSRTAAANTWYRVTYGNGRFVALATTGSGNRCMTSLDGITWTTRIGLPDNTWNGITWGDGMFVATSGDGIGNRIATSLDGITWTSRKGALDDVWNGIVFGANRFLTWNNLISPYALQSAYLLQHG